MSLSPNGVEVEESGGPAPAFSASDPIWRRRPFEHQQEIARFHYEGRHSLDASDVGVGKTMPAIAAMQRLFDVGRIKSALVITPNSIIENWCNELTANSSLRFLALRGTRQKREELIHKEPRRDVYLINFEAVRTVLDHLQWLDCDLVLCDEIHHIKSHDSQQSKCILLLGRMARARKGMTGTLLTNNLLDLWSIMQFIDPKIFNRTNYWGFRQIYMEDKNAGKSWMKWPDWQPRDGAVATVQKIIEPHCIRFEKRQVLKFLPPVLFERRYVDIEGEQKRVYHELRRHFVAELKNGPPLVAAQILPRITKLLEITSGFVYRDETIYRFEQNAKLDELKEVLENLGDKQAIVWCAFREDAKIVQGALQTQDFGLLVGDTPEKDRQAIVDLFNRGQLQYLISNPAVGGEGLTILSPYAIYYSRSWKLGERLQSLGRNDRPGAEKYENLTVIDLVARATMDEAVIAALEGKEDLLQAINPRRWERMLV